MRRQAGFTIIELLVVVTIMGILAATAFQLYNTWVQKAYGSEATLMLKRLLDGQIIYFMDHDKFFPEDGSLIEIYKDDSPSKQEIQYIEKALKITIPVGRFLDYQIQTFPATADESCTIVISADFPLFKGGSTSITGDLDKDGTVNIY